MKAKRYYFKEVSVMVILYTLYHLTESRNNVVHIR